jgi:FADH2 O2-dependent halogenase
MKPMHFDVAVLGAGFGGSLTALILDRLGLKVAVIERGTHPRFAIGESSTPTADMVLRDLSNRYSLPNLMPITSYGSWQQAYPELVCGPKRGFSYFAHQRGKEFQPTRTHTNELLVAASSDDAHADTHWLRSDVDAFFAKEVQSSGIFYSDKTEITKLTHAGSWIIEAEEKPLSLKAKFVIDATGPAAVLPKALNLEKRSLKTCSRAIYAHFEGVEPWEHILAEKQAAIGDHPFCCDRSALHHILDEGWMWQLRFNNGVTSAGFVLDENKCPDSGMSAEDEWQNLLSRYPSIARQFQSAKVVAPETGIQKTDRLQRLRSRAAGDNWALLPHTAGFIDPLNSTGIAHTLCGIERLTSTLGDHWGKSSLAEELKKYDQCLQSEFSLIDRLTSGAYRSMENFRLFTTFNMLYFAAATTYERGRISNSLGSTAAFLCADDVGFSKLVYELLDELNQLVDCPPYAEEDIATFERTVAERITPFNKVGLFDPAANNMYRYTAAMSK